ncbi:MAG: nucleotidyl transferase AbiEii/AbiGii toxin family protein [Verrucomicrobia bacterium]|nr:nucleotidyl transferase AbiEii/AbiGii toxin family protein [Verrucomicrobiota bacterium]MCH8513646.1 nucleotidyl transferase AbiEii/AbiGii toxin family protein [Kiritimatiellia bacterium]
MDLFDLFPKAVELLRARKVPFAVSGGFAAGLYRAEPRVTMDVDLGIALDRDAENVGKEILSELHLIPGTVRAAELAGGPLFAIKRKSTPVVMLVGRAQGKINGGIDLMLPSIPWVRGAVERAGDNLADFGFGPVPVLQVEDVILSKLYALQGKVRAKDLDDLQSIMDSKKELDIAFLRTQIQTLNLKLPSTGKELVPESLRILLRAKR